MGTYQFTNQRRHHREPLTGLQRILVTLTILCLLVIIVLLFTVTQAYSASWQAEQQLAPSPVAHHASPTAAAIPSPTSTPKPTPRPTPASISKTTPAPHPHTLGYAVYSGNTHLPEIALSFDDGPNPPYTSQVLTVLGNYGVKATFFVIGYRAATYPALVRQEYAQGNVIGNHTWVHPDLTKISPVAVRLQLQKTSNAIKTAIGVAPTVFRPPYGAVNSSVQSIAASMGLSTIVWNVDPRDWALPGTGAIIQNVLRSVHNGSIILMHDGGGYRSETVAALPTIITTLEQRGFHFVTIPRLIQDMGVASVATPQSQMALEDSVALFATLPHSSAFIERKKW